MPGTQVIGRTNELQVWKSSVLTCALGSNGVRSLEPIVVLRRRKRSLLLPARSGRLCPETEVPRLPQFGRDRGESGYEADIAGSSDPQRSFGAKPPTRAQDICAVIGLGDERASWNTALAVGQFP